MRERFPAINGRGTGRRHEWQRRDRTLEAEFVVILVAGFVA